MTIEQFNKAKNIIAEITELKKEFREWERESTLCKQLNKEFGAELYVSTFIDLHGSRVSVEKYIFLELVNKMISYLNDKISSLETELEKL